jgi:hypothetical protein
MVRGTGRFGFGGELGAASPPCWAIGPAGAGVLAGPEVRPGQATPGFEQLGQRSRARSRASRIAFGVRRRISAMSGRRAFASSRSAIS